MRGKIAKSSERKPMPRDGKEYEILIPETIVVVLHNGGARS